MTNDNPNSINNQSDSPKPPVIINDGGDQPKPLPWKPVEIKSQG